MATSTQWSGPRQNFPSWNENFSSLLHSFSNFHLPLQAKAQRHLFHVYLLLSLTALCSALGAVAHLYYHLGGMLSHLASFALLMALASTSGSSSSNFSSKFSDRQALLLAFGFVQGLSMGPLIEMAINVEPSLVLTAFALTANIFACLSLSALYLPRRASFALGSILSSCLSGLFWLGLLSLFAPTQLAYRVQLYLGLVVFSGYLVLDSQLMIDRAERGQSDKASQVDDALKLFQDLAAIFVRVLILLVNSQKKDQDNKKKRR
jgi:FtsH-binding integral membrane protein